MIKVPDNFRPSDYGIKLSIPKPDMECKKNDDGSFSLCARYTCKGLSDFAREAAREMNDKMEAELIDELLSLNGYVQERTCKATYHNDSDYRTVPIPRCSECRRPIIEYEDGRLANYCHYCGAKVVE